MVSQSTTLNKTFLITLKELIIYTIPIVIIFLIFSPISVSPIDSSGQPSLQNYHSTSSMIILWGMLSFSILYYLFRLKKINLNQLSLLFLGNIIGLFSISQWLLLKEMHFFWSNGTPDIVKILGTTSDFQSNFYNSFTSGGYPPLFSFTFFIYNKIFTLVSLGELKYFSILSIILFSFLAFKIYSLNFTHLNSSIIVSSLVVFSTPWEKVYPEFSIILFLGLIFCINKYKFDFVKLFLLGLSFGFLFHLYYSPFYFSFISIIYLLKKLPIKSVLFVAFGFILVTFQSLISILTSIIQNYYLTLTNITNNFNSFADNVTNISFVGDYFSYQNAFISNFEIFNNFFNSNFINLIIIFIFSIKFQKFNFKILKLRNFNILINLIFTTFIFKLFLSLIFHFSGNLNLFPRADNHLLVYLTALLFIIILQNYDLKIATSNYIKNIVILFSICVILIVKIDNFYFNIFPVTGNPAWIGIFSQ